MDKTLEAIDKSIEAWEKKLNAEWPDHVSLGPGACPLCQIFLLVHGTGDCKGCPIALKVKAKSCRQTPYSNAEFRHVEWSEASRRKGPKSFPEAKADWQKACQAEIDFLKEVREDYVNGRLQKD